MDRKTLSIDLAQAQAAAEDAARHILNMRIALMDDDPIPTVERAWAAEKLNRASEIIRRTYDA